jgi:hypothetical protein
MWRTVRNVLIGIALLVFLVWTGLIWAILGAIPVWTYVTVGVLIAVLIAFIKWAYKPKRYLSDTEKLALGVAAFLFVFIGLLIVLPWVFKFMLLAFAYLFIFVVSKGKYSVPTRGGNGGDSTPKPATGTSIVSRC